MDQGDKSVGFIQQGTVKGGGSAGDLAKYWLVAGAAAAAEVRLLLLMDPRKRARPWALPAFL
jgi:hypothetical protein